MHRLRLVALARDIEHDDALLHPDLRRGEADARRRVHGLEHRIHQAPRRVVDTGDGFRLALEAWIGRGDDGKQRHDGVYLGGVGPSVNRPRR